jgi:hypothetical protein
LRLEKNVWLFCRYLPASVPEVCLKDLVSSLKHATGHGVGFAAANHNALRESINPSSVTRPANGRHDFSVGRFSDDNH